MISEDDKNKVRDATDLVALVSETVELRPRGNTDLWGCCPFHGEKTPSFHVIPATQVCTASAAVRVATPLPT